jgi:hypothetical protein
MRLLLIVVIVTLVALAAGATWAARSGAVAESVRVRVVEEARQALGRDVRIDALSGDPWRGIVLRGVRVASPADLRCRPAPPRSRVPAGGTP